MRLYTVFAKHLAIRWPLLAIFAAFMLGAVQEGYGQDQVRRYANREEFRGQALLGLLLPGTINNSGNAVDENIETHSTLNVALGALNQMLATQFLDFGERFDPGTPVTIKLALPASALGLVDNFTIQPYTGLNYGGGVFGVGDHWRATPAGNVFTGANLLNLLSGKGTMEFTIIPTASFDGIWIQLGSTLGLAISMDIYHAYVMEPGPTLNCNERDTPIDVLSGTRAAAADLLGALSSITNPYNAINGNTTTYATLNMVVGALNTVYLNTIFPSASLPGQNVRIILENPRGLLDLSLLSAFKIQPMLGNNNAGPPLDNTSSLLNLRLLPGTTKYELAYSINESFDRIELRFDNTVTALASLRVYEVSRSAKIMLIENPTVLQDSLTNCGEVDLSKAIANYQPEHYNYRYYTVANGGMPLPSSLVSTSGTYYIDAIDPVTGCASPRVPVTANVHPLPTIVLSDITPICEGETTTGLQFSNVTNGDNQYSITWDTSTPGLNNVPFTELPGSGKISFTGLENIPQGNYTGVLKVLNPTTGCKSVDYPVELTITPLPGRASLSITNSSN